MVLSSELLAGILEEVRPLLGRGRWPITFPPWPRCLPTGWGSRSVPLKGNCSPQVTLSSPSPSRVSPRPEPHAGLDPLSGGGDLGSGGQGALGQPFNSLVQLEFEQGIPRNPFINAGALVVSDLLETRLTAPRQRTLELVRRLCGNPAIMADQVVARSGTSTPPAMPPSLI